MNPNRQPRPDAKLKRLPDPLKDEILRRCGEPGITQAAIIKWISDECGVDSSPAALSEFCSWWPARKRALVREAQAVAHMEVIREQHPDWSEDQVFAEGQKKFAIQAIADDDPKAWAVVNMSRDSRRKSELEERKAKQKDRQLDLQERDIDLKRDRFEFDAAKAALQHLDELMKIKRAPAMPEAEKINAVRQRLFGVLPINPPKS